MMKAFTTMEKICDRLERKSECKYGDLCEYCDFVDGVKAGVQQLVWNLMREEYSEKALTEEIDLRTLALNK